MDYATHLHMLADSMGATLILDPAVPLTNSEACPQADPPILSKDGRSWDTPWAIVGWAEPSVTAYYAGLHELGHIARNHSNKWKLRDVVRDEAEAWEWALDSGLVSPDANTARRIVRDWLGGYVRDYGQYDDGTGTLALKRVESRLGVSRT